MRIEPQSRQAATLHLEDGRVLKLRLAPQAVLISREDEVLIRLHFRTLRSANSPEETPLFSLDRIDASSEWKAQLAPWLAPVLEFFSQYHGGRVIVAKTLAAELALQPDMQSNPTA